MAYISKRNYFLLFSVLLNFIFIIVFVGRLQKPVIRQISDKNGPSEITQNISNVTPQVIGEKQEVVGDLIKVTKVIDGDTIRLENSETVRYIGIDTPEISGGRECFANESTAKNTELVLGKEIRLEKDVSETDRYNRLLRYVWVPLESGQGELFVNEYLVREGYATAVTYPPDVRYSELFRAAEKDARDNNRGLWSKCVSGSEQDVKLQVNTGDEKAKNDVTVIQSTGTADCSSNKYNCIDFKIHAEAQSVFDSCGGASNDIHKLDSDGDGVACESLP
ncbi:hypothetical protein A2124_00330 [Candidatus Woesebacteria bacterium GWB1_37_5]|nr:MAG: hypothetical protein A2124_00330 [Candidatus Woesebacteria bacterium GWB1_37_5]